nr:LOW QUALITY PROTEIN: exocyst complex component 2-like [Macaca fascicularis]
MKREYGWIGRKTPNILSNTNSPLRCTKPPSKNRIYVPLSIRDGEAKQYRGWEVKCELSGEWLAHAIQTVRFTHESLTALEIPNDLLQTIQDLILDLRVRCVMVTLQHTAEEIKRLAEKEDWIVDNERLTSLPCQFEQCIVCSLQSLKGVLERKPGEASVFQQPKTQEEVCQLSINIMQVFTHCLEQLSIKPDADIDTTHLSVDVSSPDLFGSIHEDFSLTSEQRLLIVLSNYCYLERHTFLNIAEHFEKHNFRGIEKITQVSMASLKELDQRLFENYIELKADPAVSYLEPGICAGYFDCKDCLLPTGVRNYLKEALVNIIAAHAEVFIISKELAPQVLFKVTEAVSEELSRLMRCVSSFSKNGALQARLEICALRDTVAVYLTPESKSSFKQALEALPQLSSGADKMLLEELLNKFRSSMHLQLTCFQAASSTMMKT